MALIAAVFAGSLVIGVGAWAQSPSEPPSGSGTSQQGAAMRRSEMMGDMKQMNQMDMSQMNRMMENCNRMMEGMNRQPSGAPTSKPNKG